MIDNGDDSEPHLRWRIIIISTIILCFLLVGFADAMKPISINDCVGVKCVVKKLMKSLRFPVGSNHLWNQVIHINGIIGHGKTSVRIVAINCPLIQKGFLKEN